MKLVVFAVFILFALMACASQVKETPDTKEPDLCHAKKAPGVKKDVEIQPYCPPESETKKPSPKPTSVPRAKPEP
jgi:hypothetical protein